MILSMGLGEPNYVPDNLISQATDSTDTGSLAFFQCYACESVQFEIICFFAVYQDIWCALSLIAEQLGCREVELAERLTHLSETKLLDEQILVTGPTYHLTQVPELRRAAIHLGSQWSPNAFYA